MDCTSYYPVLMSRNVETAARFYEGFLGFRRLFSSECYVHLQSTEDAGANLALLDPEHATIPEGFRGTPAQGLL